MQYRKVPKTGDEISAIGYGCMRFPTKMGRIDEKKAEEQMRFAIEQGVNYFDTAYPYHGGGSESFLGKVFSDKALRDQVKIATKLPPWSVKTRADMDRILNEQMAKLKIDSIDYYLVHGIMSLEDWERMKNLGVLAFLDDAKAQGKIKHAGFSFHSDIHTFKKVVDDYDWAMCQIQYNYLDETTQAGIEGLRYAAERDIAVFVMEPLRGGNLAGRMPKAAQEVWDQSHIKRSSAEWALRWVWNHPEVTCVLSGMNVDEHIQENIDAACTAFPNHLSVEELGDISKVRDVFVALTKVPCTACAYCMPCPAGVNIPMCFEKFNSKSYFGGMEAKIMYLAQGGGVMGDNPSLASQCVNCGKCETHCPQHIEIRKELKNVSKSLEGIFDKPIIWMAKKAMKR
ncbi:aldo/keto reductase [Fusibacter ferrireducens]|uniref:Aldo/keto reductase n=1 Tax=Fusibacter ferrireducens TaxID=2785058 RepID=A0ABR9ZPR4_9FIRM|nr:aldo/keto reductase [Fusibacter ferrireducens]MBF4692409.1 aldo/keto reductase [Fusibacter ferrireducens]